MNLWMILSSALRLSIPILFAAYGGMLSERSGIANIALEGNLMVAAFSGAALAHLSGSLIVGIAGGVLVSALVAFLFAVTCVWGRGDQIVVGTGFNLLIMGLIPVINKTMFGNTGSTPSLPSELTLHSVWPFAVLAVACWGFFEVMFRYTRHGLRIIAAGENPQALSTQGVNFRWLRVRAVVEGGIVTGIGGIYLSLCQGSGYVREMSAGRGFIALAALVFGGWRPLPTMGACLFFALADAVQIQLQGKQIFSVDVPNQFVQIIPFVATLLVLVLYNRKILAPAAINRADS